jgi:hypothetical protein
MSVCVINQRSQPLMPCSERKARLLLKQGKAKVKELKPFTIQLSIPTGETTQEIKLGIDSGYNNVGFSAITENKELIVGELKLLQGMKERLLEKARYVNYP